ncbi:alpha-(1-_3)-arabinofuranosyltransferase domain-containing protein [Marmoricola sp. RAF53]|uniref:alpha-(1->3)-arabinofuranosyltransferase domain-containing protein n=1 Tax=Marmoricola sp. RAF53 TaxID=3233059 RepID=UPI003F99ED31
MHTSRLHLAACALLLYVAFAQRIGETTFDTKFDLTADPLAALRRSLTLWGTEQNFGGLQNQAYGYLFPQGTWFSLADLVHLPDWVAQRLWSALILLLAYDGARRLCRALGIGSSAVPVLVGLTYALTPRILGLSGVLTAEVLPSAVLPWVCLPLVLALAGRLSPRRAGVLSGLAVLLMGGVNAVENLATMPLPFLLVLAGAGTAAGRRLAFWWAGATALASLWWMLPLLLLGRYSPPFLDYVENAATTTRTTGWSNSVRGAEHWLNYILIGGRPWWEGAHALSVAPALVIAAGVLAALGLFGLVHPRMSLRIPFALSALLGLVCLTAGHGGPAGTLFAEDIRTLLDGPLAPFRNVHKVDPLVRLPIALGFGTLCMVLAERVRRSGRLRDASRMPFGRARHLGVAVAAVALLLGSAPAFAGQLRHDHGWDRVPAAWDEAAAWLDADGPGTTLVVPSSGIGQQTWGWTVDEPVQGLSGSDWATRTQVPLVPASTIRMLDALDDRLEDGGGSAALAGELASAGISRILLRNDLDVVAGDVADPARVAAALAASPGITEVHRFGRSGLATVPMIQIFRVDPAPLTPELAPADLPLLTGGPEDVITAREAGLVPDGDHVVVGLAGKGESPDIVGDAYRRVERQYGRLHGAVSQVMTAEEKTRLGRKVEDYPGVEGVPRVVAEYADLDVVTASSSAGYVDGFGRTRPELGPASVADGDPATYWSSAPFEDPVGQWVDLRFDQPRPVGLVAVRAGVDKYLGAPVRKVAIQAGNRRKEVDVDPDTGMALADFKQDLAESVRVTVLAVGPHRPGATVALRDVVVSGIDQRRTLVVPDTGADEHTSFVFSAEPPRRACLKTVLGPACDALEARPGAEQGRVDRRFTVNGAGTWSLSGQVVALPGPAAAAALLPLGDALRATSDSVLGDDPAVSAMFAVDGRGDTSWIAALGDLHPEIEISWDGPRRISRLQIDPSLVESSTPYLADIEGADGQRRTVELGTGQLGYFEPFRTDKVRITFHARRELSRPTLPVGIGEIRIAGVDDLAHPVATSFSFTGACGLGPDVRIDGTLHRTRVTGSLADVVDARPLTWSTCGQDREVELSAGPHRLEAVATDTWTPTLISLRAAASRLPAADAAEAAEPRTLSATPRSDEMHFDVGTGPAAVLVLGQNANTGWRADLDGKRLTAQVVDGWQQGFVVPAGDGGKLVVRYAPAPVYRIALGLGLLGALLLVALLLLDLLRPSPLLGPALGRSTATGAVRSTLRQRRVSAVVLLAGLGVATVLGGPVLAVTIAVGVLLCRVLDRTVVAGVGAAAVALSGVVAVAGGHLGSGEPVDLADLVAAVGVGLLAATLSRFALHEDDHGHV